MTSINQKKPFRQASFLTNIYNYFKTLSKTKLMVIEQLIQCANIFGYIHPSQLWIARRAGLSRKTVNKIIFQLEEEGLLIKKYNHRRPCDYYLHPQLYDLDFRKTFRNLIKAFNWLPTTLLLSVKLSSLVFVNTSQCEYVTPLNNSSNYLKKQTANSLRKETANVESNLTNVSNCGSDASSLSNRKEESQEMSQSEIIISAKAASVAEMLGMNEEQEIQLSKYDDKLIDKAYRKTQLAKPRNPIAYLLRICVLETQEAINKPNIRRLDATIPPKAEAVAIKPAKKVKNSFDKEYTAEEIANEIVKISEMDASKLYGGEDYKQRILQNWSDKEYISNGSEYELVALRIIDKYRKKFNMPLRLGNEKTIKGSVDDLSTRLTPIINIGELEPGSPLTNEYDPRKALYHQDENRSPTTNFDYEEYEEVLD